MAGITLTIEVDDKGSVKVKQFADESKKAFDQMQKGPQAAQGPLNSLRESWVGLTAKVAAATAVIYAVQKALSSFVNEAAEAEQIENRLKFALETTGYQWSIAKSHVDQFASSIQEMTRFSDEQARQALTDMMMYTNDFSKAQMGAKLAMDMSIRTGQDLGSTSRLIGMAMSGNVEMLGRYIPQLRNLDAVLGENATMAQKAEYALKILNEKFGGTAQADIDSYAGKLGQFKNAWSDFKEKIGNELLPPLKELLDTLKKITEEITKEPPYKEIPLAKFWGMEITRRVPLKGEELQEVLLQRQRVAAYQSQKLAGETKRDVLPERKTEEYPEWRKIIGEERVQQEIDYWEAQKRTWEIEDNLKRIEGDRAQLLADDMFPSMETVKSIQEEMTAGAEALRVKLVEMRNLVIDFGWEDYGSGASDASDVATREINRMALAAQYSVSGMGTIWESVGQSISSAWASNMTNIIRSTESTSQKIKSFFQSIGDVFLSTVSKMIAQWLIFGSVTGKKESGGGWLSGGLWSGLLGWILGEGGVTGPLLAHYPIKKYSQGGIASSPQIGIFGEGGNDEAFVPLKSGKIPVEMRKKGGDTYVYFVNPIGFDQALMKNMGTILKGVAKDARMAGPMHSIMKGNG